MDMLKRWWTNHGTKILGYGTAALGMIEMLDAHTIQVVQSVLGPKWGNIVSGFLQIIAGAAVARRGYMNSKRSNASHPA